MHVNNLLAAVPVLASLVQAIPQSSEPAAKEAASGDKFPTCNKNTWKCLFWLEEDSNRDWATNFCLQVLDLPKTNTITVSSARLD